MRQLDAVAAPQEEHVSATMDADKSESGEALPILALVTAAAQIGRLDSTHAFVREGDLKFRVGNVPEATYRIERLTQQLGGYVRNTQLAASRQSFTQHRISRDTLQEIEHYTVTNQLLVRVPAMHLDSFLRGLVPLVDHLDARNLSCRDITLELLAEELARKRQQRHSGAVQTAVDNAPDSKLSAKVDAQNTVLSSETAADAALLEKLTLEDKVQFSTLAISIYQPNLVRTHLVPVPETPVQWKPSAGEKLGRAMSKGWLGLLELVFVLALLWPLWLAGAVAWLIVRRVQKRQRAAAPKFPAN